MSEEEKRLDISEIIAKINPHYDKPIWEHTLIYDSTSEQLEPIYFWILDFVNDLFNKDVTKIIDNFSASPGSGYFGELGQKAKIMQEEGMKILNVVNSVIKSVINILYSLKEFEIRLDQYDLAQSKNARDHESGVLGLKQIWMDKVDIQRGNTSIKGMASQFMYATLIDAFMAVKRLSDVDRLDLNDRVKRILKPRVAEFFVWKEKSEKELRKRFEIEKSYLKTQVNSLRLYSRWAKPYLRAAEELMMKGRSREPALVKAFNTILLELTILGKSTINIVKEVDLENLPKSFRNLKLKRKYYSCVFIDFVFRGIPSRSPQGHYIFGGRTEVNFKAYSLNEDEMKVFEKELDKEDFRDALRLTEIVTEETFNQIIEDIEHFIDTGKKEKETKQKKPEKKKKEPELGKIRKDNFEESVIRALSERTSAAFCYKIYDIYKKSHGMPSITEPDWQLPEKWRIPK